MRTGDYQTEAQATAYHINRFSGGLRFVHKQESDIVSHWLDDIRISQTSSILDIASGTGRMIAQMLLYHPKKIYALDSSKAMLGQLSKNYFKEIEKNNIVLIQGDAANIPLKKRSIDLATAMHLFKHLPNIGPVLASVSQVLKPNGYLIFDILNSHSLIRFNLGGCYAYTFAQIKKSLGKEGLIIKDVVHLQVLGETLYKITGSRLSSIVNLIDQTITQANIRIGTKMLILAMKQS